MRQVMADAVLVLFLMIPTAVCRDAAGSDVEAWQRILSEERAFTAPQMRKMEEDAALVAAFQNIRGGFMTLKMSPLPEKPVSIDLVTSWYGKPDKEGAGVLGSGEAVDEYTWGRIILITKKGEKGIIGLGAPGAFFLDGLKTSATAGTKTDAPPLPPMGVDRDTYLKRVGDTAGMKAALDGWGPALKAATSEGTDDLALFDLLGKLDPLWDKEQKLKLEVSSRFVARMRAVDPDVLATWQSAFGRAAGHEPSRANTLVLIIQQDRLFDKVVLKDDMAARWLARLRSLPVESVKEWADLTKQAGAPAAVYLLNQDSIFQDSAFQEGAFRKLYDDAKARLKAK